ncbi:hypothetical protein Tco_0593767 [Tanacetum coccineum]
MGVIFSLEARDMDTKLLLAPESNNTLARCWFRRNIAVWQVTVTGRRLLPVAGPLFLQFLSAFLTQGTVSSISIIFSWGGSISPEGFLSSVMLWLVIIVAVVGVGVTVVVVIIVAVVVVVESWAKEFHQDRASSVKVPVANFTLLSSVQLLWENTYSVLSNQRMRPIVHSEPLKLIVFAMLAACASRAVVTLSATNFMMAARVMASASDVDILLGGILST